MIRGILFDCFGVLYHGSLGHLGELTPPHRLQELHDLSHSFDYGYITQAEYFERVGILINRTAEQVDIICQAEHTRNERMVQLIRQLRLDYKVGLLSNVGRGFIDQLFTHKELRELFDAEILSNEVHMAKPNREIYELAATQLGLTPQECVMIDDILDNVNGAIDVGMRGIVCSSTAQTTAELNEMLERHYA